MLITVDSIKSRIMKSTQITITNKRATKINQKHARQINQRYVEFYRREVRQRILYKREARQRM